MKKTGAKFMVVLIGFAADNIASLGGHRLGLDIAVLAVVGVFLPILHPVLDIAGGPVGGEGLVLSGHIGGGSGIPATEGVAGLRGAAQADDRAIAGIDGVSAPAASQVQAEQIVVAVVVNLHLGAAVGGNLSGGVVQQGGEALVGGLGQARTDLGLGVAGPGLGVGQGVVIVVRVLLIVLDSEVHLSGLVGDDFRDIVVDGGVMQFHRRPVRRVAHHGGAGHGVVVGRPPGESRRPGRRCLRVVCKDVFDDDRVGVFLFAFGKRWQGHQRQGHDQRQHECQRPFPCFHFLIPPISFILGAGRPQLTWVLRG